MCCQRSTPRDGMSLGEEGIVEAGDGDLERGGTHVRLDHQLSELAVVEQVDRRQVRHFDLFTCTEAVATEGEHDTARGGVLVQAATEGHDIEARCGVVRSKDTYSDALFAQATCETCAEGSELVPFGGVEFEADIAESFHDECDDTDELFVIAFGEDAFEATNELRLVLRLPLFEGFKGLREGDLVFDERPSAFGACFEQRGFPSGGA